MENSNDTNHFTPLIPQNNNHHTQPPSDSFITNVIHGATKIVQPLHVVYTDTHIHVKDAKLYEDTANNDNHQKTQNHQQQNHTHPQQSHQPNLHDLAHMKSEDIRQKTEYSQIDGKLIVQRDELAVMSSTITGNIKSHAVDYKIKTGNQFQDEIDSVPKQLDPSAPSYQASSSIMPEFEFKEAPYKCEEYKSVYEDSKSMYNATYGDTGGSYTMKEYKSVYDPK